MVEEKKGHVKVSLDVEINAALMEMMKDCIENMPQVTQKLAEKRKKEE